jgi:hypothetical protein
LHRAYARAILRGLFAAGAIFVVACTACGGHAGTEDESVADASSVDACPDSTCAYIVGDDATTDSSLEASLAPDASTNDATGVGDANDASNAGDASEAGDSIPDASTGDVVNVHTPCDDACALGEQQCRPLPQVCTYDDAGFTVGCAPQGEGIATCVVAETGCTVWGEGAACRSDVPCCVACEQGACAVGSLGEPCERDTDCASDACDALLRECVSNQCADHRQDGSETGVDCGGLVCNACQGGQGCQTSFDCQAGQYCTPSRVCSGPSLDASPGDAAEQPPPCHDACALGDQACSLLPQVCTYDDAGITLSCKAPGEGIWTCVAGNAGCAVWAPGAACGSGGPCCSGCQPMACDAGAGSLCWSCPAGSDGKPCEQDGDCASDACDAVSHECTASQCADHRLDGMETDVDCGGPDCGACLYSQRCESNRDCLPGDVCMNNGYWDTCR